MEKKKISKTKRSKSAVLLIIYISILYLSLPFAPSIWGYWNMTCSGFASNSGFVFISLVSLGAAFLLFSGGKTLKESSGISQWVGIAAFASLSAGLMISLSRFPAERLHLVEYGILAWLSLKVTDNGERTPLKAIGLSVVVCFLTSLGDEIIQGLLPGREFELKDIFVNLESSILLLYLTGFILRRRLRGEDLFPPTLNYLANLAAYPLFLIGILLSFNASVVSGAEKRFQPNIILFTIDSLRPDHMGCYGYMSNTTPAINKLAETGVTFTNAHAGSAWTSPNLVSIFTGDYPSRHGVLSRGDSPHQHLVTLCELLRIKGYVIPDLTSMTDEPNFYFLGFGGKETDILERTSGAEQGEAVVEWLKKREGSNDLKKRPFFIWYHCTYPHLPYEYDENMLPRFLSIPLPEESRRSVGLSAVLKDMIIPAGSVTFNPSDTIYIKALYDSGVRKADMAVERIVRMLKLLHLYDKTIFIVTADHGEELLDHGFIGHASTSKKAKLYEEITRIPLVFHYRRGFLSGMKRDDPVQNVDIMPTLCEYLGVDMAGIPPIDGKSFLSLLVKKRAEYSRKWIFCETNSEGFQQQGKNGKSYGFSLEKNKLKVIEWINDGKIIQREFFDLTADPWETNPLDFSSDPLARIRFDVVERELERRVNEAFELQQQGGRSNRGNSIMEQLTGIFRGDRQGVVKKSAGRVEIVEPDSGMVLRRSRTGGIIELKWKGNDSEYYIVEYRIGGGDYRLEGEFPVQGNHQVYGPFDMESWGRMSMYNPWSFRVRVENNPGSASEWVSFTLAE